MKNEEFYFKYKLVNKQRQHNYVIYIIKYDKDFVYKTKPR